jgi:Mce-associated membrane protein
MTTPAGKQRRPPRVAGQRRQVAQPPAPEPKPSGRFRRVRKPETATTSGPAAPEVLEAPASRGERRTEPTVEPSWSLAGSPGFDWTTAVLVLTVAAVILAGLGWLVWWEHGRQGAGQRAVSTGEDAVAAAKPELAAVLSYDYRHFDADVAKASSGLTSSFRTQYQQAQATTVQKPALTYKASVSADVVAAGVIDVKNSKHVLVLVFVNQTSSNTKLAAPRIDRSRVRVDMRKVGGHWLINAVTPL